MSTPFFATEGFWAFFFGQPGHHFYEAAVYGNVVAVLPLAVLGLFGWLWHRGVVGELHAKVDGLAAAHAEHAQHFKQILDALDPDTDGGIADLRDRLDPDTPGGIGVIRKQLDTLTQPKEPQGAHR